MITSRRIVLVVEDAGACATTLEIALAQIDNLDVRVVPSAEDAWAVIDNDAGICAIVTDLQLPKASGLDLIRWLRSRGGSIRLPIIVISGDSDPDTPATTLRLGANAFFGKPFSPSEVRQRLEELINARESTSPV
jgi:DNA-binding response OmpR family regulator